MTTASASVWCLTRSGANCVGWARSHSLCWPPAGRTDWVHTRLALCDRLGDTFLQGRTRPPPGQSCVLSWHTGWQAAWAMDQGNDRLKGLAAPGGSRPTGNSIWSTAIHDGRGDARRAVWLRPLTCIPQVALLRRATIAWLLAFHHHLSGNWESVAPFLAPPDANSRGRPPHFSPITSAGQECPTQSVVTTPPFVSSQVASTTGGARSWSSVYRTHPSESDWQKPLSRTLTSAPAWFGQGVGHALPSKSPSWGGSTALPLVQDGGLLLAPARGPGPERHIRYTAASSSRHARLGVSPFHRATNRILSLQTTGIALH